MTQQSFDIFLLAMAVLAAIVFITLYYVEAGYGMFFNKRWGFPIPNKIAWLCMEAPVFFVMLYFWSTSDRQFDTVPFVFFLLFELHYLQRAFIFPFLLRGKSNMPAGIMMMAVVFNLLNGYMQGTWVFRLAPDTLYTIDWLYTPQFIIGVVLFFAGMGINKHSDYIIRNLRKPGDTAHYLPKGGFFNYVTSANYWGEIVEWIGFSVLTWSISGAVFAWWTIANLVPRANAIYKRYKAEFGDELGNRKRVIPFLY